MGLGLFIFRVSRYMILYGEMLQTHVQLEDQISVFMTRGDMRSLVVSPDIGQLGTSGAPFQYSK